MWIDVGCGTGRFWDPLFSNAIKIIGVDINFRMLEIARAQEAPGVNLVCGDARDLPIADRTADCVLASMLLEHIEERHKFFRESARILKKSGSLILRTMLPDDIDQTTWYSFLPRARNLELDRTIDIAELRGLAAQAGMSVYAVKSYQDEVAPSVSVRLPERLAGERLRDSWAT